MRKILAFVIALSLMPFASGRDSEVVMVISPHPDDGEIFCGGTILWYESRNIKVVEVFVTSGGASSDPSGRKGKELEIAREAEAMRVTKAFGIDEIEFLRFPDGGVNVNESTESAISEAIGMHNPSIIYAPEFIDPFYKHSDHIATGTIIDRVASCVVRFYDYAPAPKQNNVYVDVTEFLEEKNALLYGYESQRSVIDQATQLLPLVYLLNGLRAGKPARYCEGFREAHY